VRWLKLGEVENECTSHNSIVLAVRLPKISKFGEDLTKFWQKQVGSFFGPPCTSKRLVARFLQTFCLSDDWLTLTVHVSTSDNFIFSAIK